MKTLEQLEAGLATVPIGTSWYLSDLGEALGKQELFTRQTPQKLKVLRQHALIESSISSNRIEGVTVEENRVLPVLLGRAPLHDRDEEEVRGYRDALQLIHKKKTTVSQKSIKELHRLARADTGDAGSYKRRDSNIIERLPDGEIRIRFKTVSASDTPRFMAELVDKWSQALEERWVHPLIALAAFNLDFLCIHPFRDGNGRVSRLLLLLQL